MRATMRTASCGVTFSLVQCRQITHLNTDIWPWNRPKRPRGQRQRMDILSSET